MTVLSAQSISYLCNNQRPPRKPLIDPFVEAGIVGTKSYGLSACSYDCRSAQRIVIPAGRTYLASTVERFCLPFNVCGSVLDKSTYARQFLSAFNTHLDPGWEGYLTVELVNLQRPPSLWRRILARLKIIKLPQTEIVIETGHPLVQIKFEWLDKPTTLPYRGKYQHQSSDPQGAL